MSDINVTVYPATRAVATAPNYTDNKTTAAAGNNYYIPNTGRLYLILAAATTANVTVETPNTVDGNAIADLVLALADTKVRVFGPFPPGYYNDSQGRLKVTVSANTSLLAVRM